MSITRRTYVSSRIYLLTKVIAEKARDHLLAHSVPSRPRFLFIDPILRALHVSHNKELVAVIRKFSFVYPCCERIEEGQADFFEKRGSEVPDEGVAVAGVSVNK